MMTVSKNKTMQKKMATTCCPTVRGEMKKARAGNYDFSACVFEFIDNALDAGADHIKIDVREKRGTGIPHKFIISDNSACGINREQMIAIFSWTFERDRCSTDVGEYGTGFKTAGVNLGDKLTLLSIHNGQATQAIADWQDMSDEDRWEPQVMDVTTDYFFDTHPFSHGSTFIIEGLRHDLFPSFTSCDTKLVCFLFQKLFDDIAYYYRYILRENKTLTIILKGSRSPDKEVCDVHIREHDLFRGSVDPSWFSDDPNENDDTLSVDIHVYKDTLQFFRVYFQHNKKWHTIEFVDKRKNGNSLLKCHEVSPVLFDTMCKVDLVVFRSVHLCDQVVSAACMALYPTCTIDIVRRGRVMGRNLMFRQPRAEPLQYFVHHEVWYQSYELNGLLGVQFNKQNSGTVRENSLRYTIEYLQQLHEREFYKSEKTRHENKPSEKINDVHQQSGSTKTHEVETRRKNFSSQTKIQVLKKQECRDSVFDFFLKDEVLLMEYDHKNGIPSHNTQENCQVLSVISHSVKTRYPMVFDNITRDETRKVEFIVKLLNCITRSKFFIHAWTTGTVRTRDTQEQLRVVQDGLFWFQEEV